MVLTLVLVATWSRYARSSFLDVIRQDYIRTAKSKGLSGGRVLPATRFPMRSSPRGPARRATADAVFGCAGGGDDLRLARHGPSFRRCAQYEGIFDPDGHGHVHGAVRDRRQPARRYRDRADRSARQADLRGTRHDRHRHRPPPERPFLRPDDLRRFMGHRLAVAGAIVVVLLCFSALFAQFLAPHDPLLIDTPKRFLPPFASWEYPLGTDDLGRDTLSRLLYGGQVSLIVGIVAMLTTVVTGTLVGLAAGYYGGVDR